MASRSLSQLFAVGLLASCGATLLAGCAAQTSAPPAAAPVVEKAPEPPPPPPQEEEAKVERSVSEVLSEIDQLLVMSVNPGFGGQTFIPRTLHKVAEARDLLREAGSTAIIEVDGGVDEHNAGALTAAGAGILVAGASIFGTPDPARAVRALRDAAMRAVPR